MSGAGRNLLLLSGATVFVVGLARCSSQGSSGGGAPPDGASSADDSGADGPEDSAVGSDASSGKDGARDGAADGPVGRQCYRPMPLSCPTRRAPPAMCQAGTVECPKTDCVGGHRLCCPAGTACVETTGSGSSSTEGCGELACAEAAVPTTYICVPATMQWCGSGTSSEYAGGCEGGVAISNLGCELPTGTDAEAPDQCFWYGGDCSPWCDPGYSRLDASPMQTGCYLPDGGFFTGGP